MIFDPARYVSFTSKQKQAFRYVGKGYRQFYGGARGGGKSHFCLDLCWLVCCQYAGIRAVIIRESYNELEDNFISNFLDRFPETYRGRRIYKYRQKEKTAIFFNKSRLMFRAVETEKDARKLQGIEYQLLCIDEAVNFEPRVILKLSGSLRTSLNHTFVPSLVMTGNPGGISDQYFVSRFVKPDYAKWTAAELRHKAKFVYIHATVDDNPHVNPEYVEWLDSLPEDLRNAWRYGKWDSFYGQFFSEWNERVHVVQNFEIPQHWLKIRGLDLGYTSHPTVCLWMAQNPETGRAFVYREYADVGPVEHHIRQIEARSDPEEHIAGTYADPSMFNTGQRERFDSESIDRMFLHSGIPLERAINDRVNGWQVVKQWLHWRGTAETIRQPPMLRVFTTCTELIETLPTLRYSSTKARQRIEDCDTTMKDDAADALRYGLASGLGYPINYPLPESERVIDTRPRREAGQEAALLVFDGMHITPQCNFG